MRSTPTGDHGRRGRGRALLAAIALAASATACDVVAGVDEEATEPAGTARLVEQVQDLQREIREGVGHESDEQFDLVARAEARLVTACLREQGVDYEMPDPTSFEQGLSRVFPEGAELWLLEATTFGVTDAVSEPGMRERLRASDEPPPIPPPPEGFDAAYWGDPPVTISVETYAGDTGQIVVSGCRGEAKRRLYGEEPADYERTRLALLRLTDLHRIVISRSAVADATRDWSRCMRQAGSDVDSPDELSLPLADALVPVVEDGAATARLDELERALAADDRACKRSSGLRHAYARAFVEEAEQALTEVEGAFVEHRRMLDHAVAVAEDVVTGEGS